MRPTFARFDFQDLLDTLPPVMRQPMVVATIGSVFAHALLALGLPVMAGGDQKKPERVVGVVSLTPEEQAKLPSTMANLPGSGLKGTSLVPLPLGPDGTISPLNGLLGKNSLTGGTNSIGSAYNNSIPGLLDPPPITVSSGKSDISDLWKPPLRSSNSGFKISTTKFEIPTNLNVDKQVEERKQRDQTDLPPDERPPAEVPKLNAATIPAQNPESTKPPEAPISVAQASPGVLSDSGNPISPAPTQPNPSQQAPQKPGAPQQIATVAQAWGPWSADKTAAVDKATTVKAIEAFDRKGGVFEEIEKKIGKKLDLDTFEEQTMREMPEISLPLEVPKTSDQPTNAAAPAEFVLVLESNGKLMITQTTDGKQTLNSLQLRLTGYANLDNQAVNYLQTRIADLQKVIDQKIKDKGLTSYEKYSYLKLILVPQAGAPATPIS
jgi:hypothetical protein